MEEVLRVLEEVKPDVDFSVEKSLIDDAILDSFDIISIVNGLNDAFDIEITVAELLPENFNSQNAFVPIEADAD